MLSELFVAPECDPVIVYRLVNELLKVRPEVIYGDFCACNKFDRMIEVHRIACPTLIIRGAKDRLTPMKYSEYLNHKTENSKLVVILETGHSTMLEKHPA